MRPPTLILPRLLESRGAAIEGMLAPCYDLEPASGEGAPHGDGTRIFGEPLLGHLGDWPRNPEGEPMLFVGQCRLEHLPAGPPELRQLLPEAGVLSLFWDVNHPAAGGETEDRYRFRVLWTPEAAGCRRLPPPPGAPSLAVPSFSLAARVRWRLPAEGDAAFQLGALDEREHAAYSRLCAAIAPDCEHRLLGPPDWLEADARPLCVEATRSLWRSEPSDWRLLWQIGAVDELCGALGGDFRLYVMIRDEDLRAARFLRAWVVMQGL